MKSVIIKDNDDKVIISTGQGGNPGGRHSSDLVDDWIAGRTVRR